MNHLEQQLKEFDEKFDGLWIDGMEDYGTGKTFTREESIINIKQFLTQSHIKYLQSEIDRLKGEVIPDEPVIGKRLKDEKQRVYGYNLAIKDQIAHYKQKIINAEKLLNK